MTNTRYGVNESRKLFCKKHQEFHPSNESCRWCDWRSCMQDVAPPPIADPDCYHCGGSGVVSMFTYSYQCTCTDDAWKHIPGSP